MVTKLHCHGVRERNVTIEGLEFHVYCTYTHRNAVVDKIAYIVKELRRLRVDHIGPIGSGKSEGPWFSDDDAGPFSTLGDLEEWYTHKLNVMKRFGSVAEDSPSFAGKFTHSVMCRMVIAPRNIILDAEDNIWLIDWGFSGAYPPVSKELH